MANVQDVTAAILGFTGPISTMKLQKLLYLCQGWHLAWDAEPLFDAEIQAWANGPVVYDVYEQHSGVFKVGPSWSAGTATDLEENETETVDAVVDMYTDWSARQLVIYTHEHRPWLEARGELPDGARSNNRISLDSMTDFFGGL